MNMKRPTKAVILAAGLGTRMRPLSYDRPKPMMPVWGKPVIDHTIAMLASWGVRDILVNLHHLPGEVLEHLRRRKLDGVRVSLSFEPDILGTGGPLRKADWFFAGADDPFWMINADIAVDVSPSPLLHEFKARKPIAALWLHPELGPRTVEMKSGGITCFRSKTPCGPGTYTFCGLQLLSPEILRYIPDGFSSIVDAYEKAMAKGHRISGVTVPKSFWTDLGSPERYVQAHRDIQRQWRNKAPGGNLFDPASFAVARRLRAEGVKIKGFLSIAGNATVSNGAVLEDSIVWDNAVIGPRSGIKGAVVATCARVNRAVGGPAVPCDRIRGDSTLHLALKHMKWNPADVLALPMGARGSARSFTRLVWGRESVILINYSLKRPENAHYSGHARFLRSHGVRVPRLLLDMPGLHASLIEDLGDMSLESAVCDASPARKERLYVGVIEELARMHRITPRDLDKAHIMTEAAFSSIVYRWERELMTNYFLEKRLKLDSNTIARINRELEQVAEILEDAPPVLVHRDMQSTNVILAGGRPHFIDFQSMRPGPAAYDVASLLCDPYVMLPEDMQMRLLDHYLARSRNPAAVAKTFWPAAVQRLTQALGAYGRLCIDCGLTEYEKKFQPALIMMKRALKHVNHHSEFPAAS